MTGGHTNNSFSGVTGGREDSSLLKVAGNQKNISFFSEAYARGKVSHAYIIEGPEDSGKESFADAVAASLLCQNVRPGDPLISASAPCGRCPSCIKAVSGNHPDIIHVRHEKATVLSVDEIREQVVADIAIKPYYGPYKIYIIRDAQLMNDRGQNALLKSIEEPAEYGIIFLLTDNADGLLPTIRSRCIRISMEPLPREETVRNLMDDDGRRLLEILETVPSMTAVEINQAAKELESFDKARSLKIMQLWLRDQLVLKSTGDAGNLYFADRPALREQAAHASYEGLNRVRLAAETAGERIKMNVKAEAAYEAMLLTFRRELR